MELIENINNFIESAEKYKAWNGKTYYRTFGNIEHYMYFCCKFGVTPRVVTSGLSYEAKNEYVELDYCEHDIILCVNRIKEVNKYGAEYEYQVVDKIPDGFHIWNVGEHAPKNILPLVVCDKDYHINTKHMLAIITDDAQTILKAVGITGDTIPEMKKYIKTHNDIFSERMKKAIECLKSIDNRRTTNRNIKKN